MADRKRPTKKPDVNRLLSRLAAEEDQFLAREFLAPAVSGGVVRVRIAGVVCNIRIEPREFSGWGVFQPSSHSTAKLVREASLTERRTYLALFPMIRLIVCRRVGAVWCGSAASFGDARIRLEGLAPLQLADEVQWFDCVQTRYDGTQFWFDQHDGRCDPAAAAYLRAALNELLPPEDLSRPELTAEQRAAYEVNFWERTRPAEAQGDAVRPQHNPPHRRRGRERSPAADLTAEPEADQVRRRLRESLSHAGAQLLDYLERADSFRVSYLVGGQRYTSSVNKEDLTVEVAGICLSGEDRKFDLASMVGVLREGGRDGGILQVGDEYGMGEEDDWRIHPPRD
jgi:hypothetical protein